MEFDWKDDGSAKNKKGSNYGDKVINSLRKAIEKEQAKRW